MNVIVIDKRDDLMYKKNGDGCWITNYDCRILLLKIYNRTWKKI